ncbi:uncharacterized protein [Argopecten irradians]|uniref:uncharacterized protein n=1 Tax=Argopecten irradians TaxID=31199 RepID=UPI0037200740
METEEFKRTRVYVMGGRGHGKTTVINLLLDQMNPPSNRGDISVYTGYVVADNTKEGVYLDMWELPGGRLLKSLYPVLLTEPAIYLVLVTADTHDPDVDVIDTCQNIMFKVHEPHIIVILTKTDSTKCRNINIGDLCLRIKDKWNEFTIKCRREIVNRSTLKAGIFPDTGAQFTVTGNSCSLVVHPFNASDSQSLHWSENPHKGDFQITVHFCCPCGMPIGLVLRILALCVNLNKPFTRYSYIWRHGVLIQLGHEVKIHIQAITNELDFTVRVVTDSYSDLKTATQVLWMTVAPSLVKLLRFFKCFPGLSTEVYLSFRGDPNFDEVFLRSTSDRRFTIDQLVSKQILRTELMSSRWLVPFKVNSTVKTFETWLEFLMTNRKDVLQILAPEMLYPLASNALPGIVRGDKNHRKAKQKTSKVTWDMDTKHTEPKNNNDSVNYSDSGGNNSKEVDKSPYHSNKTTSLPVRKISEKISKCRKEQTSTSNSEADKLFDEHAALRVASSLAAAVLSASVVRYMEEENSIIHTWSSAQVLAVRDISQLSSSVWEGNMANISSAITHAVAKDTRCHTKASKLCHSPAIQSTKFCTIL